MKPNFLTIDPEDDIDVLKGLASPIRIRILKLLRSEGRLNVNDISHRLGLPQSTVAINVQMLEEAGLIATEAVKAKKGHQKICSARFDEIIVRFETDEAAARRQSWSRWRCRSACSPPSRSRRRAGCARPTA